LTGDGGPLLSSYLVVERRDGDEWTPVARDGDWGTTIEWLGKSARAQWRVPSDASGEHRLVYADVDKQTPTNGLRIASPGGDGTRNGQPA
jgi:hypothetical protein